MDKNTTRDTLFEIEEMFTELLGDLSHLKSLLYFLSDFFEYEALDVDSPSENIRTHSYYMLSHYRDYQSMFEILNRTVYDMNTRAEALDNAL